MQQSHHNHEGLDFTVYRFEDGTFQASHTHGLCGFGKSAAAACQDAFSVESVYGVYDAVWRLEDYLTGALRADPAHRVRLTAARDPLTRWLTGYDAQRATYIEAVHLMSAALDAFAECGYAIDTDDIWSAQS